MPTTAKKAPAKKSAAKAKTERVASALGRFPDDATIKLLVEGNARRPGSAAFKDFAKYKNGLSIAEFVKLGGKRSRIATDVRRKNIEIVPPKK